MPRDKYTIEKYATAKKNLIIFWLFEGIKMSLKAYRTFLLWLIFISGLFFAMAYFSMVYFSRGLFSDAVYFSMVCFPIDPLDGAMIIRFLVLALRLKALDMKQCAILCSFINLFPIQPSRYIWTVVHQSILTRACERETYWWRFRLRLQNLCFALM